MATRCEASHLTCDIAHDGRPTGSALDRRKLRAYGQAGHRADDPADGVNFPRYHVTHEVQVICFKDGDNVVRTRYSIDALHARQRVKCPGDVFSLAHRRFNEDKRFGSYGSPPA